MAAVMFSSIQNAFAEDKYFYGDYSDPYGIWEHDSSWWPYGVPAAGDNVALTNDEWFSISLNSDTPILNSLSIGGSNYNNPITLRVYYGSLNALDQYIGNYGAGVLEQYDGVNKASYIHVGQYVLLGGTLHTDHMYVGNEGGEGLFRQYGGFCHVGHDPETNQFISNTALTIGRSFHSTGTYEFSGGDLYANRVVVGTRGGTGLFYQGQSGMGWPESMGVGTDLVVGEGAGSVGTYVCTFGDFRAERVIIGTGGGTGTFNQYDNGDCTVTNHLIIGEGAGSLGTYNLSGYGVANFYNNNNNAYTSIGYNGGSGYFNSQGDFATDYLCLGRNNGTAYTGAHSVGEFNQSSGDVDAYRLYLGFSSGAEGYYNQSGGTLDIDSDIYIGYAGYGEFCLSGTGSLRSRYMQVASSSDAGFYQSGGSVSILNNMYVGRYAEITGIYCLSGGSLTVPSEYIGDVGEGVFNQSGGTHTVNTSLTIGGNSSGIGTYNLTNSGILSAYREYIGSTGYGVFNQSGGAHTVTTDLVIGRKQNSSSGGGTGIYNLSGGSLNVGSNLNVQTDDGSAGTFNFSGGNVSAANLVNYGVFNVNNGGAPGDPLVVDSNVDNYGEFRITQAVVEFKDSFVNNNAFYSDPSQMTFNNLSVNSNGFIQAGADQYVVKGDFINKSAQASAWDTTNAQLLFSEGAHNVVFNGLDLGATETGYVNNFAWGDVSFNNGTFTLGQLNDGTWGALYTGTLSGLALDGASVTNIAGGSNIYYLAQPNAWLGGKTYSFTGGGQLRPVGVVPEPISSVLFLVGAGVFGVAAQKRRKA